MAHFGISIDNRGPLVAGSPLIGTVYATISKEIRGSHLTVVFRGKENTKVRYTVSTGTGEDRRTETRYAYAERRIVDMLLPTQGLGFQNNGTVLPGKYVVPFQFEIPASLPSSMYETSYGGYFSIRYKIKAELKGSGYFRNYQTNHELRVLGRPPPIDRTPFEQQPVSKQVKLCCCFNRGTMTCGARLAAITVAKGEAVDISFSCRNHTTVAIDRVAAYLHQNVRWSARGHYDSKRHTIQTCTFSNDAGLAPKPELLPRGDSVRLDQIEILKEMRSAPNTQKLIIPGNALVTYQGQLGSVRHDLVIVVSTSCCIDNPEIRIPIRIAEVPVYPPPTAPGATHPTPTAPHVAEAEIVLPPQPTAPISEPEFVLPAEYTEATVITAEPIKVGGHQAITGGLAMDIDNEDSEEEIVVAPGNYGADPPCFQTLLKEMKESLTDVDIVERHVNDPAWKPIFATMTPSNFGLIMAQVDSMFDEVEVAVLVAHNIENFTCQHVAEALKKGNDFNRSSMIEKLLKYCKDFPAKEQVIKSVLTPWELTVTERAFQQEALSKEHE